MSYQKFEIVKMKRSEIIESVYNPRVFPEEARKKLKKIIKQNGLVMPLVVNKQTNNTLVSGHFRLSILDELEKNEDYELDVALIDVDKKKEAELNITLNNASAMGEWDIGKLELVIEEFDLDPIKELNFDKLDLDFMNIDVKIDPKTDKAKVITSEEKELEKNKIVEDLQTLRDQKHEYRKQQKAKFEEEGGSIYGEQNDYILTVVFNTNKDKQDFCAKIGVERSKKMIKYSKLFDVLKDQYK